jgi:hypothetical protein
MGSIYVKQFTGGLDSRRLPEVTPNGSLIRAYDCHINRGGEVEKRHAFVKEYDLSAGNTKGLFALSGGLYVFGHDTAPSPVSTPTGVSYQRLQHPGAATLSRVLSVTQTAGKIYAAAEFSDATRYHYYDGTRVTDWYDGRSRATFEVTATAGSIRILVNGVAIDSGAVSFNTTAEQTATDIASNINAHTSSPDYTAVASGTNVTIVAATAGTASNGFAVVFTLSGGFTVTPSSGLTLTGGAASTTSYQVGSHVATLSQKVYSVSGPLAHFSGLNNPSKWTVSTTGAGFIDMSAEDAEASSLVAVARYLSYAAFFAERVVLIWRIDPDPANYSSAQALNNTGTKSPRSITQFGDTDLFYCDASGIRSLKARDSSGAATTTDIGVLIDTLVQEKLAELTDTERTYQVVGVIEPNTGRFWMAMKDIIYVLSYFPGANVRAWTAYRPTYINDSDETVEFEIDDMVVYNRRVYIRSGDEIFCYGGISTGTTYDATEAEVWLPYLDADKPAMEKEWLGFDVACSGEWLAEIGLEPTNLSSEDALGRVWNTTFNATNRIPINRRGTHASLRFTSKNSAAAKLASVMLHYSMDGDEDK